ncbi:MAG TPA: serine protease [Candidatus Acidoferrales bacterium]|nr:serine protease [Candidatus Acidoferrales bacterium]
MRMSWKPIWTATGVIVSLLAASGLGGRTIAAQSQGSPFRLISSTSGTKETTKNEHYIIEDPRDVFHVPGDQQIVVVFDWQGPPGMHHFQGSWMDPTGKVVSVGNVDLQATGSEFSCSWSLNIPDSVKPGLWAIQVTIDGLPAAVHTFQIVSTAPKAPPAPPSAAEVYQRAVAATVFIDNLDRNGNVIREGSGFFIGKGKLVTAFQVIDGANSLEVKFPNGQDATTNLLLAWSRRQDWAILKVDAQGAQALEPAPANSWKVGDDGYLLGSPSGNGRTIETVGITGIQQSPIAGERINTSWYGTARTIGSPFLDVYGRVIGVLGGSLIPGIETLRDSHDESLDAAFVPLVTPVSLLPLDAAAHQALSLSDLAAKNEFVQPLSGGLILSGTLCKNFTKVGDVALTPMDQATRFSRTRDEVAIVITWTPDRNVKDKLQLRIFALDNHLVEESQPAKIELWARETAYSGLRVPIASIQPGTYRADLFLGEQPVWRTFFKIIE